MRVKIHSFDVEYSVGDLVSWFKGILPFWSTSFCYININGDLFFNASNNLVCEACLCSLGDAIIVNWEV